MRRPSALLVAVLTLAGCGIQLRPPPPAAPAEQATQDAKALWSPRPNPVLPEPNPDPLMPTPGQTVLTFTFDDGRTSNATAGNLLHDYHLPGTFFVNSGNIGKTGYLTLPQLDDIATEGHEIAGHTLTHLDLGSLPLDQVRHQVCDDRDQLLDWGYPVRNFAYPFGSTNADIEAIVHECGYNSARSLGETKTFHVPENAGANDCSLCSLAEELPPGDPYYTKAPAQARSNWSLNDLEQQVVQAQDNGGGWVQLTFHGLCPTDCSYITTSVDEFEQFLGWVVQQQAENLLVVATVGDVIGGPLAGPVTVQ